MYATVIRNIVFMKNGGLKVLMGVHVVKQIWKITPGDLGVDTESQCDPNSDIAEPNVAKTKHTTYKTRQQMHNID